MIYLRVIIELYFKFPLSPALENRINAARNAIEAILGNARKINPGKPNKENSTLMKITDEVISGITYRHVSADIAIDYPVTQPVQAKLNAIKIQIDNLLPYAEISPEVPLQDGLSIIQKKATKHVCTHEPPVQSCTGVTNL